MPKGRSTRPANRPSRRHEILERPFRRVRRAQRTAAPTVDGEFENRRFCFAPDDRCGGGATAADDTGHLTAFSIAATNESISALVRFSVTAISRPSPLAVVTGVPARNPSSAIRSTTLSGAGFPSFNQRHKLIDPQLKGRACRSPAIIKTNWLSSRRGVTGLSSQTVRTASAGPDIS